MQVLTKLSICTVRPVTERLCKSPGRADLAEGGRCPRLCVAFPQVVLLLYVLITVPLRVAFDAEVVFGSAAFWCAQPPLQ